MSSPALTGVAESLLAELEKAGAVIDNGLYLPADLTYEQYEAVGTMLGLLHRSNCWLIGDWLNFGEHVYGEKYAQAALLIGLSEQTCANYSSIARRVPPSRRVATVSFSIHAEVASLPPQEQAQLLEQARDERLTKMDVRERARGVAARLTGLDPEPLAALPPAVEAITCPHCGHEFYS